MKTEHIKLNESRNVTLTAYILEVGGEFRNIAKRPAVLILPGGGYQFCSDREADPVAMPYLAAGYQAFILRYSVKEHAQWPNPLEDYEQAMALIRSKAGEWNLYGDKIAVIGFSAGGHLAAAAATMSVNRPNAAILGYAVVSGDVKGCNPSAPDTIGAVDKNTCPCFLFSTRTDNIVTIANSIDFMKALSNHDIAFESHIYAYGPHGYSTGDSSVQGADSYMCARLADWVPDSVGWLRDVLGEFGPEGVKPPLCKKHITQDHEDFLSVDCSFGLLMSNPDAAAVIEKMKNKMQGPGEPVNFDTNVLFKKMTLRDMLAFCGVERDAVEMLDGALREIPNR